MSAEYADVVFLRSSMNGSAPKRESDPKQAQAHGMSRLTAAVRKRRRNQAVVDAEAGARKWAALDEDAFAAAIRRAMGGEQ